MKLTNGDRAIVGDVKLLGYMLNPSHETGKNHALLFRRLLGIDASNGERLRAALLHAAKTAEAIPGHPSRYGTKYEVRFRMAGMGEKAYTVLSVWQIDRGDDRPRLVTAYVE